VTNRTLASLGVSNAAVQLGISSLQLALSQTSTAKTAAMISGQAIASQISGVVNDAFRPPRLDFTMRSPPAGPAYTKPGARRPLPNGNGVLRTVAPAP
jgi:hypothetical protein